MANFSITNVDPAIVHERLVELQCQRCGRKTSMGHARAFSQGPPDTSGQVTILVPVDGMENALRCDHRDAVAYLAPIPSLPMRDRFGLNAINDFARQALVFLVDGPIG